MGVLGATSMVGKSLLPLLADAGWDVTAFSRQSRFAGQTGEQDGRIISRLLEGGDYGHLASLAAQEKIAHWVCLAPVWVLPDYFPVLTAYKARRVVVLSSTSIFTKKGSSDPVEQKMADKLCNGERHLIAWAEASLIEWVILRPTLIYGLGRDRNVCEIARLVSRFGFFPLSGAAQGLRQPVHVEDVANACIAALQSTRAINHAYNLSGAESVPYREMVERIFRTMGRPARFIGIPLGAFRATIACLRIFPRFRKWSAGMAERMNNDMVFDHTDAANDLGFSPRPFQLAKTDLPPDLLIRRG